MDLILLGKAVLLGVVEGLTEFLPISSTGHLILVGDLLDFNDERGKAFEVIIQFGAILAVCWEFREKLWKVATTIKTSTASRRFVFNLIIASIPAMGLAFIFGKHIKALLFSPIPVASAFIVGGLIIFWAERRQLKVNPSKSRIQTVDDLKSMDALKVGLAQCAALIPGTSRSGATIIGGMLFGLPRAVATEFSFFLAIPVIGGATAYELLKLWKNPVALSSDFTWAIVVGFISAFISAFICVRWLIHYVAGHNFIPFAWYRIVFGVLVLVSAYSGLVAWSQ
ncbi:MULTISPECIES: undecaprenyl-diphosphate phosphatase [unclassified Polynucleobacter]|uniref:undecaprenyl-diphosphate phosphatase n=1 Tax=unclassified Polynucleobacter TaxID=2640945 RepID=UPI0008D2F11C|nr:MULTISPECIES: undecaprenyl-diphosphate phosphatase [unclassified Polynucleobacter]OHC09706.1 MAG: undecaprenyl-diphosphatase [Polynucleobacter sp. GWA2_45_21]HBK43805.1 undecaprenyl-diphosphatase [Polynucleobacter sp.]